MQIYEYGSPGASVVLIEPIHVPEGMEQEASLIRELAGRNFHLLAVKADWFRDLSPWQAPAINGKLSFGDGAPEMLERICSSTAAALKCSAEVELERLIKPLVNDEKMFERLKNSAVKVLDNETDFKMAKPAMLGEDFAEYASRIPCVFAHLGASGEYPLHSSHLIFDEKAMLTGMACEVRFALDYLEEA